MFAVFFLIIVFLAYASNEGGKIIEKEKQEMSSMSNRDLQALSTGWTYESLLRDADVFEGKIIHVTGRVTIPTKNGVFGIDLDDSGEESE